MRAKVVSSNHPVFHLALEEIAQKIEDKKPDFVFLAISPLYPPEDVPKLIERILQIEGDKYLAFNAIDAFENLRIVEHGVTACFIYFEGKGKAKPYHFPNIERRMASKALMEEVVALFKEREKNLNIIIADYIHGLFPLFFRRLSSELEKKEVDASTVVGGIVSTVIDRERHPGYIFSEGEVFKNSFSLISFEGVQFEIGLSTGIFKRGPIYTITSGKGFFIYELDGKPAGFLIETLLRGIDKKRTEYLWYTPLVILGEEGELLALRTFKSFTDRYIEVWAPIEEGQKVKLAIVIPEEILKDTENTATKIKGKLGLTELVLNFSCTARQYTLEDRAREEVEVYGKILNAPVFGFFTHGEIALGIDKKKLKLHNQTSVVVAIKEEV